MRKETFSRLIKDYLKNNTVDKLPDHISYLIDQECIIKNRMNKLRQEKNKERDRRLNIDNNFNEELKEIQLKCPHFEYVFYSDPAGVSDSYYSCDLCGYRW